MENNIDFKKENLQLTIKISELINKVDELKKENKQLKEDYIKATYESILANKRTYI